MEEDITSFGEELDQLDLRPGEPEADEDMRADMIQALDSYETAKRTVTRVVRLEDVSAVTECLMEGRFTLALLDARRTGSPLPERRPACFFDPRHGMSTSDVPWTPPGGVTRPVPMCAADATRVANGAEPVIREVVSASGELRPHWEAGPSYRPWAGPYFGDFDMARSPQPPFWPLPRHMTITPDLTGMAINDARLEASRAHVSLDARHIDPESPPTQGIVARQHPQPGVQVVRNTTVTVWLRFALPYPTWGKPR
ncbi:PASTA domain-containing protein [Nonomuraea sp. NPDC049709]|uniref:PASTA domain-containing protein n=1 Tax=Nonomuraea sp. NPDC049709 TaxID=3154736 RepID=UPI0034472A59